MPSNELAKYKMGLDPKVFLPAIGVWLLVSIGIAMKMARRMELGLGPAVGAFAGFFFGGTILWIVFSVTDLIASPGLKLLAQLGLCLLVTILLGAILLAFTL